MGIAFSGTPFSADVVAELVRYAERRGFHSAWLAEDYFLRDAVTVMSFCAARTKKIKIGTGIINPYTRHPILIAETIATLDEATRGRAFLALGTGVGPLIEQMGIAFTKPLKAVSEGVQIIRKALAGGEVDFDGEVFKVKGVKLGSNPYLEPLGEFKPRRRSVPIYIAAIGPRMLQLAGRLGDGVLLTAGCAAPYVRNMVVENVAKGAEESGRSAKDIDITAYLLASVEPTAAEKHILKSFIAFELSYASPEYLKASEADEALAESVRSTLQSDGLAAAAAKVDDETLRHFTAYGKPREIGERIREYIEAGLKTPSILPIAKQPQRVKRVIDVVAREAIGGRRR